MAIVLASSSSSPADGGMCGVATSAVCATAWYGFGAGMYGGAAGPAPDEQVAVHDEHRRLWAAVRTLTERCQELLRVVAFEEHPDYARISVRLGMPVGSIGPTRARCLGKLRVALAGDPA